jgi:RimJ/RimL family protein N-acetyltransferase
VNYLLLHLRLAKLDDVEQIFEIRNKQEVRENSFNSEMIDFKTHQEWCNNSLNNPARRLLVLEMGDKIIGVLRYDINGDSAEISIYIDPPYFGKGCAEIMLEKGRVWLQDFAPEITKLTARILDKNLKSQNLFSKLGFTKVDQVYRKKI